MFELKDIKIDMVVVNLYPFEQVISKGFTEEALKILIGRSLIRAAAAILRMFQLQFGRLQV